jgi:hypothetical protein
VLAEKWQVRLTGHGWNAGQHGEKCGADRSPSAHHPLHLRCRSPLRESNSRKSRGPPPFENTATQAEPGAKTPAHQHQAVDERIREAELFGGFLNRHRGDFGAVLPLGVDRRCFGNDCLVDGFDNLGVAHRPAAHRMLLGRVVEVSPARGLTESIDRCIVLDPDEPRVVGPRIGRRGRERQAVARRFGAGAGDAGDNEAEPCERCGARGPASCSHRTHSPRVAPLVHERRRGNAIHACRLRRAARNRR